MWPRLPLTAIFSPPAVISSPFTVNSPALNALAPPFADVVSAETDNGLHGDRQRSPRRLTTISAQTTTPFRPLRLLRRGKCAFAGGADSA